MKWRERTPRFIIVADTVKKGWRMVPPLRSLMPSGAKIFVTSDKAIDGVRGLSADRILDVRSRRTRHSNYADDVSSMCLVGGASK